MNKIVFGLVVSLILNLSAHAEDLIKMRPQSPADNDRFIKEYFTTKDIKIIQNMFDEYQKADDATLKDAYRFFQLNSISKMPNNTRPELAKTTSVAALTKYQCNPMTPRCTHFLMLSSGLWALASLSQRDDNIKEKYVSFSNKNERIAKIFKAENNLLSNYMNLQMLYIAKPDELDPIMTKYEQLGSLDIDIVKKNLDKKK